MSVPAGGGGGHVGARWETVSSALDSNARTLRLCLILFVMALSPAVAIAAAAALHHALLILLAK